MTLQEMGVSYFKTWKGKALLIITLMAAIAFVCFFADTLASNTYVPKKGPSVLEKFTENDSNENESAGNQQKSQA